jgi:hypothetical protein
MKRWSRKLKKYIENPKVDAFLGEILEVCKKHDLAIVYNHDNLLVTDFTEHDAQFLDTALDDTGWGVDLTQIVKT